MASNTMDSSNVTTAIQFEETYKKAYRLVDEGINKMTEAKNLEACKLFQEGIIFLDIALNTKIETFDVSAEKIQMYAEMQIKMRCTRKEVLCYFSDAQIGHKPPVMNDYGITDAPPSYEECTSGTFMSGGSDATISNTEAFVSYPSLDNLQSPDLGPQRGELVLKIENGVQIFFIYADGNVTSPSIPSFLAIYMLPEPICNDEATGGARGFLQVGEWNYPLIPTHSPSLHSFYGAYMFPDLSSTVKGTSVGIILPDTCSNEQIKLFEEILSNMTSFQSQVPPPGVSAIQEEEKMKKSATESLSEGAEAVSKGIVWGAEKLSEWITFGSEKIKSSVKPSETPKPVDPSLQKTAQAARKVSGEAVKVSGYILNQVGKATMALGRKMAPSIQKQGTKVLGSMTGQSSENANKQMEGYMEVASGAVRGASTIYLGLENAAFILAQSLSDNTVNVVTHTYGPEAGNLTGDTLYTVGQTAATGYNISSMGAKGIAKRAAKDTGKAVLEGYSKPKETNKENSTKNSERK